MLRGDFFHVGAGVSGALWRRWLLILLAGALASALAACNPFTLTYTYRYRITVEIDTPQGLRSGSSVWETSAWQGSGVPDSAIRSRERGEAVAVDLPGGTLFALLRGPDMEYNYAAGMVESQYNRIHQLKLDPNKGWKTLRRQVMDSRQPLTLDRDFYPLLVRFRDINDPASVEKVEPFDLAARFGPGVSLRRITVAVTHDAVTEGIEKRFSWWDQYRRRSFDGASTVSENMRGPRLSAHLSIGDFSTEYNK